MMSDLSLSVPVAGEIVDDAAVDGEVHRQPDGKGQDDALEDVEVPAQEDEGGDGGQDDEEHRQDAAGGNLSCRA